MKNLILKIDKNTGKLSKTIFSPLGKVVLGFLCAGLMFLFVAPSSTYSATPTVNLDMSGTGSTPWSVANIKPGDTGVQSVTIHNTGSSPGKVTIWLSNVSLSKSAAVDPKFGTTPQINQYLKLSLTGTGVTSNFTMPTVFANFPQSATSSNYIHIDNLDADASTDLTWTWDLPSVTGNPVQGDSITFDINYMIEEITAPVVPPVTTSPAVPVVTPVPSNPDNEVRSLQIDVPGAQTIAQTTADGTITNQGEVTTTSTQVEFSISLAPGTTVTNPADPSELPQKIEAVVTDQTFPSLPGWEQVSPVFDVEGVTYGQKHSLVMDKSATISIGYDPDKLPSCYEDIAVFYFDQTLKTWVRLEEPPGYVAEVGQEAALVNHFSIFCVLCKPGAGAPIGPAKFEMHDISAGPSVITVGEETNVKVGVSNTGGQTGDYTVTLLINGVAQQTQTVTLGPLECKEIYFAVAPGSAGKYQIQVGDQTFNVTVVNTPAPVPPQTQPNVIKKVIVAASPYTWLILLAIGIVALMTLLFRTKSTR
jgi:hypothetical protein